MAQTVQELANIYGQLPNRKVPFVLCGGCADARNIRVLLDGEDVTERCTFADEHNSCVVLLKPDLHKPHGRFLTCLDFTDPSDPDAQYEGLQVEFKRGTVEIKAWDDTPSP